MELLYRVGARLDTDDILQRLRVHDFREEGGMRSKMLAKASNDVFIRPSDLRKFSPSTRHDQGDTNSCTANAGTRALEIKRIQKYGMAKHIPLSRAWLYFACREAMVPPEMDRDEGTSAALVAEMLKRKGIPTEVPVPGRSPREAWGWKASSEYLCTEPSWMAARAAYVHKIETWSRIRSAGQNKFEDLVLNLAVDNPVTVAMPVDASWNAPGATTVLRTPKFVSGWHAVLIVGWNPDRGVFIIENSWGDNWCDRGFGYLDAEYVINEARDLTSYQGGFEEWRKAA